MDNTNTVDEVKTKPQSKPISQSIIYVTTTKVNCRKNAGVENPVVVIVPELTNVTGTGETKKDSDGIDWYGIKFEKHKGFICSKYLKKK